MAKTRTRTVFCCQQCGGEQSKWLGRCPECGTWNSLVEMQVERSAPGAVTASLPKAEPQSLPTITADRVERITVAYEEFNRVLGGGIVPGSLILIGGEPGVGKSTLLAQISGALVRTIGTVLYISGEESVQQIKLRADRLGINDAGLYLLAETSLDNAMAAMERLQPRAVVVDSIQTMYLDDLESAAGSVSQVRECAVRLQRWAKARHVPIFLVGHVTKEGAIAGPRVLEHIVDCVLYLEGERFQSYRLLRSTKNRFGSTYEVGVFEMRGDGLVEVHNPSAAFLAERSAAATGSAVTVTMEGTRPILVEIQALTSPSPSSLTRRTANGIDPNRLHLLTAVLTKRVGLNLSAQDVFVNVVGGLKIGEPAADLAVALAIASSYRDLPLDHETVYLGEVGLGGELRSTGQLERRLLEAAKLGFNQALIPAAVKRDRIKVDGMRLIPVPDLASAIAVFDPLPF
ncbi:MAG: DNA repair protein RadA [Chloroflexota bacterium]|nr:DNA repair protein RadA [Dehalococcoidia bacterium]MDW8255099.1 DNA repair protein RadA [Chloroflexota bacterium]